MPQNLYEQRTDTHSYATHTTHHSSLYNTTRNNSFTLLPKNTTRKYISLLYFLYNSQHASIFQIVTYIFWLTWSYLFPSNMILVIITSIHFPYPIDFSSIVRTNLLIHYSWSSFCCTGKPSPLLLQPPFNVINFNQLHMQQIHDLHTDTPPSGELFRKTT